MRAHCLQGRKHMETSMRDLNTAEFAIVSGGCEDERECDPYYNPDADTGGGSNGGSSGGSSGGSTGGSTGGGGGGRSGGGSGTSPGSQGPTWFGAPVTYTY